jgi:hypothetical protein
MDITQTDKKEHFSFLNLFLKVPALYIFFVAYTGSLRDAKNASSFKIRA